MGLLKNVVKTVVSAPVKLPSEVAKGIAAGAKDAENELGTLADWLFEGKKPS